MTLRLSLEEAMTEVKLLKVRMFRYGCSYKSSIFQELSDCLCLLLKLIEFKEKEGRKARRAGRQPPPWTHQTQTASHHKAFF